MATPVFLRYLPARLKPLRSPLVWAPLVALGLLGIFAWEYYKNPDRANRQPDLEADAVNSEFTPEEQARLSEIDTLDALLRGTETPGGGTVIGPDSLLPETPAADNSRQLSGQSDPFGIYTTQYKFPGASAATPNGSTRLTTPSASASPSSLSGSGFNGGIPTTPPAASTSALSDALDRQRSAQSDSSASGSSAGNGAASRTQPGSAIGTQRETRPASGINSSGIAGSGAGGTSAGSIAAPYIRTTPDMSPPVGTTGYRAPATSNLPVFNQAPAQPSRNPYSPAPAPASTQPALPGPTAQPGVSYTPPSFTQPSQTRQVR